jgi:hypothetical protein
MDNYTFTKSLQYHCIVCAHVITIFLIHRQTLASRNLRYPLCANARNLGTSASNLHGSVSATTLDCFYADIPSPVLLLRVCVVKLALRCCPGTNVCQNCFVGDDVIIAENSGHDWVAVHSWFVDSSVGCLRGHYPTILRWGIEGKLFWGPRQRWTWFDTWGI